MEIDLDDDGTQKERKVYIDHENFYEGRVFGELESRAAVHMEVGLKQYMLNGATLVPAKY